MRDPHAYRIVDEPAPSKLSGLVVAPLFPLLAAMLAGQWLAWPWFVLNGIAMGSVHRRKEQVVVVVAAVVAVVWTLIVLELDRRELLSDVVARLLILALTTWKLGCATWLHQLQSPSHELFSYYGGKGLPAARAVVFLVVATTLLRPLLLGAIDSLWLELVLAGGL